jgi:hypothetical protein
VQSGLKEIIGYDTNKIPNRTLSVVHPLKWMIPNNNNNNNNNNKRIKK